VGELEFVEALEHAAHVGVEILHHPGQRVWSVALSASLARRAMGWSDRAKFLRHGPRRVRRVERNNKKWPFAVSLDSEARSVKCRT
jgi:hypothetical protein